MAIRLSATRLDLGNARLDNADLRGYAETTNALGNVSGATGIDLSLGTVVTATTTAATTFSVSNVPSATQFCSFTIVLTNGGRFTTTWMSGTKWQNSVAPTLSVIGTDVLTFFTTDNGTTWRGSVMMASVSAGSQMFVWGYGTRGRLGLSDTIHRSSPVQLSGTWSSVQGAGFQPFSGALKSDGSLWTWGKGQYGRLGVGDTLDRSSPTQVSGTWASATLGSYNMAAFRPDATAWVWGISHFGILGLGNITTYNSPVQISGNWSSFSLSRIHSGGIKTDSTLWSWGHNHYAGFGNLGHGDTIMRSSPAQIAGTWSVVSLGDPHFGALKPDSSLWVWSWNSLGSLGLGDTIGRSSPVQVPGTWSAISFGNGSSSAALKSDGSLWMWGNNSNGRLGLGDTAHRSSPVQILGTWSAVNLSTYHGFALKSDGSLWVWGTNTNGGLGLGDTVHRSSPVQVLGTWASISSASLGGLGLRP